MDGTLIILIIAIAVLGGIYTLINQKISGNISNDKDIKKSNYRYYAKNYIMTQRENQFFSLLNEEFLVQNGMSFRKYIFQHY